MQIFYTLTAKQSMPLVPGATLPDDDKGLSILSAMAAMTALASLAVCLRMYVRTRIVRIVGMDYYVMLLALVYDPSRSSKMLRVRLTDLQAMFIAGFCIVIPEVHYGAGRHFAYLQPERVSVGLKLNFITQPIYLWANTLVKISIAFSFLRIVPSTSYRHFLYGSIVFLRAVHVRMLFHHPLSVQATKYSVGWTGGQGSLIYAYDFENVELCERLSVSVSR